MKFRVSQVQSIQIIGIDADLVQSALQEWTSSPFWSPSPSTQFWFTFVSDTLLGHDYGQCLKPYATVRENALATHIRSTAQTYLEWKAVSNFCDDAPAISLVDRYVSRAHGTCTPQILSTLDYACASKSATSALIHLSDGRVLNGSIPVVMALIIADALKSSVRYPVEHGIATILGAFADNSPDTSPVGRRKVLLDSGASVLDVTCVLPITAGRIARSRLVSSPHCGVPVGLYPLMASVIPEVSGDLVPIMNASSILGEIENSDNIEAVSRVRALIWMITRLNGADFVGRIAFDAIFNRFRSFSRRPFIARILHLLRIDRERMRDVVDRMLSRASDNSWIKISSLGTFELSAIDIEPMVSD